MFSLEHLEHRALFANYTAAITTELLDCIKSANLTPETDTITLVPGNTFSLTAVNNTTSGATGLPVIAAAGGGLTIVGNGATIERSAAAGTPRFRLFDVAAGASLTIKNLTLQGGSGTYAVFGQPARGGAIHNQGALNLESVTVQNNTSQGSPGVFVWSSLIDGGHAQGGAIYSAGSLSLTNCAIRGNSAVGGVGLDKAWYTITGNEGTGSLITVFRGSKGGDALGGAIYIAGGTAAARTSVFADNSVTGGAGGEGRGNSVAAGLYIKAPATVGLDVFTKQHLKNKDIFGAYSLIR